MIRSKILGVGSFVPEGVVKNDDLRTQWGIDTTDEWIRQRTGIEERRWVEQDSDVGPSDLAVVACTRALKSAGVDKSEIDMIVFATLSPDHEFPGAGCFLQAKLGLPGIPAIDIRQQCTGFIYGISVADQYIRSGEKKRILVVGAEVQSRALDKTTRGREISVLFGDGAGAVVVGDAKSEDTGGPQILSTHLHADGAYARELWLKYPGTAIKGERMTPKLLEGIEYYPEMNGKTVFQHAVKKMPEAIMEGLNKNDLKISDVDLFVFHQANLRINEYVAKVLEIPEEKVFNTIQKYGNTTAATIPIGLDEAVRAGKLKPGMTVALAAFGSGFTWGSAILRW